MLTKYALVAIIVLCITVLGFTLLVHSSLCELSIKERNIEFKEGANKQVISSQADSLIKISRIWADFFPANTSNQPI